MDWKKKCSEWGEQAKKIWAAFLVVLGKAWAWTLEFLKKSKVWLQQATAFCAKHLKHLLGILAVLALRCRKWVLKTTARLRVWWSGWKGREWLAAKAEVVKRWFAKLWKKEYAPEEVPVPMEPVVQEQPVYLVQEEPEELPPVQPAPRRRVRKEPEPPMEKVFAVLQTIGKGLKVTCVWIYKLRRFIMAVPVIFWSIKLAIANAGRLPEIVGLNIQANGEFARMVSRNTAVMGPLVMTGFCLLLVFCSKKPLLPWMISIFTLIMPVLIWMTNYYA